MNLVDKFIIAATSKGQTVKNDYVGGGDVLKYLGNNESKQAYDEMNTQQMFKFAVIPLLKYLTIILIIVIIVMIVIRTMRITVVRKGKGAEQQLKNIEKIRKKERHMIAVNTAINKITDTVEHSIFRISKAEAKELQYKIHRADIKTLDGRNLMRAETFNALRVVMKFILSAVGVIIILTVNITLGSMLVILALTATNTVTDIYIKTKVDAKDAEIKEHFTGFYLMLHYVLMRNPNAPLTPVIQSYDKTIDSDEMHKLVDICVHNFNTYGEYSGSTYVAEEYRGVNEVVKLMRLVRQAGSGGDIRSELDGFKRELINEEAYRADLKKKKALALADRAKIIVWILLVQGIISAMTIYLSDIGGSLTQF